MNHRLICAAVFLLAGTLAWADVAPTQYVGSTIGAKNNATVQMERAVVEIVWGKPGTLSATFTMLNPSPEPQEMSVGFPMPAYDAAGIRGIEPLTMTFDGVPATVIPPSDDSDPEKEAHEWAWYRCQHTFRPGKTQVVVQAAQRASGVYATAYQQALYYCIETGGSWAGPIGEEEVTIRFPGPIEKEQIIHASPAGYQIDGDRVRWHFHDLEPAGKESDIAVTFVQPEAMRMIMSLRADVRRNPASAAASLKLARHLLALGYAKSNSGFPPGSLDDATYTALREKIADPAQRKIFIDHYQPAGPGRYAPSDTEWTPERVSLVQILADAGYRDQQSRNHFILEGERLLQETLKREPHNAEAWDTYLASYWRFSFAALGHWFGPTRLGREQARLIDAAASACPDDECIRLWLDLRRSPPESRDPARLLELIARRGFLEVEYPKPF